LVEEYDIPVYDADIFVRDIELANYYEAACKALSKKDSTRYKLVSNWVMTEVMRVLSEKYITADQFDVPPAHIAEIAELLAEDTISSKIAKEIFPEVLEGKSPKAIVEEKGLAQVNDTSEFEAIVKKVVEENPDSVEKYRADRTRVMGFFVGEVMKATKGKANPKIVTDLVKKYLEA
jgi:aspartyl-tRNA(Asn)/glutamyl-tRNA(Gln) amidotransferase subunit B